MKAPTIPEFDGWRQSEIGRWFFDHVLASYARATAEENGRSVGRAQEKDLILNAGIVNGVEQVIQLDPFSEERNEAKSDGQQPIGEGQVRQH